MRGNPGVRRQILSAGDRFGRLSRLHSVEPEDDLRAGMAHDSDADAIARAGRGEQAAAAELYELYSRRIFRMAYLSLRNREAAEDVVQECFLRLWRNAADWREGTPVLPWLVLTAKNLCIDQLRRLRRVGPPEDAVSDIDETDLERDLYSAQLVARVRKAIAELPPRQRDALMLTWAGELSNAEAGQMMGVSEQAIESILSRARRGLRALLQDTKDPTGTSWS
jgi:RNA polymerase sigma-70 factor (ECF subfamily)